MRGGSTMTKTTIPATACTIVMKSSFSEGNAGNLCKDKHNGHKPGSSKFHPN